MKSICKICGTETSNLGNHVQYKHVRSGEIESQEEYYRKYVYEGDSEKLGKCVVCGKPVPFISAAKGYRIHCCHECSQKDPDVRTRKKECTKKALLEKYGVEYASQIPGVVDKAKASKVCKYGSVNNIDKQRQTCLGKYGVDNVAKVKEVVEKRNKTNLERYGTTMPANESVRQGVARKRTKEQYGVEHWRQRKDVQDRQKDTCKERYGGVLMGSSEVRKKIQETWKEKYGTEHPNQNPEQLAKSLATKEEIYGVDNLFKLPEIHEKARTTMLEKYGHEYAMQVPEFFEKQKKHSKGVYRLRRYTFKSTGKTLSYLSKMELAFLEDCDRLGLDIDRGDQVDYAFNGGSHVFNVDFRINHSDGTKQLVEIKGTNVFYFKALESGLQDAKNDAAIQYSTVMGYKPYLYLLNYNRRDIEKWI